VVGGGWGVWVVRCMACGHPAVAVAPAEADPPFECSVCHEMAMVRDEERAAHAEAL